MVLIFAHYYDQEAKWLSEQLPFQPGGLKVKLVIAEALGIDYDVSLALENDAAHPVIIFKENKGSFIYDDISLVINRLIYIDPIIWNKSAEKEKSYAANEINSFFAAFIHSFTCPVVNAIEHGSLLGGNAGNLQLLKILTQHKVNIHPCIFEENNHSFKLMELNGGKCIRVMRWDGKIFFSHRDIISGFKSKLKKVLTQQQQTSTLELFFIKINGGYQLIYISKIPALSMYGQPLLQHLSATINSMQLCY